ncbi:E3 ubiquitin ligase family protein [Oscillochloris sp. ZM17-4]|uniref:E3 ubiquitin ligase family protein n=1 Tax=Oscillochloris sp. ZM17-4 TaxID=2866714 RepID=UPI001C729FB4|nr:E3 ubiquitin ligase family protein [Oscillochloris sp. ZM17-4]MBX0326279.1 E3 ubiquitin ligase family protein [Oscillochloris sp. ZM17-4]
MAILLAIAIALALAGIVAAAFAWRGEGSILAMRETETMSVAEVAARHRAGRLGQLVEVVGTIECDSPLRAPYSEALCVAYDYSVTEDKERLGYGGPLGANRQHSMIHQRGQRNVGHTFDLHDSRVPRFYVRDASGRMAVDTAGARIDLLETVARFESYTGAELNVERQIWREERALPLGNRVYILACLADDGGEPVLMRHPVDRARRFIISHRDERTLLRSTRLRTYGLYLFSGLSIGGALLLAAFAMRLL